MQIGRTSRGIFLRPLKKGYAHVHGKRILKILAGIAILVFILNSPLAPKTHVLAEVPAGESEYFIPGFSQDLRTILVDIDNDPVITNTMHNVITVSVGGDNTTVYYDHWENGYGTGTTGADEIYTANKGDILTFRIPRHSVQPPRQQHGFLSGKHLPGRRLPGRPIEFLLRRARPDLRGRRRGIGRASLLADFQRHGVCQRLGNIPRQTLPDQLYHPGWRRLRHPAFADFEQVFVIAQASEDGTTIQIDDPRTANVDLTTTLGRGEVTQLSHIGKGTSVSANHPVQVQFIVGEFNARRVFREPQLYGGSQRIVVVHLLRPGPGFCRRPNTELYTL